MSMPTSQPAAKRVWYQRAWRSLRKRWVQVLVVLIVGSIAGAISWWSLAPNKNKMAQMSRRPIQVSPLRQTPKWS